MIQPPGEPREQRLGEVYQKSSSYTKFHKRQNYRNGRYTLGHFLKKRKKVQNEVTGPKTAFLVNLTENFRKLCFFGSSR